MSTRPANFVWHELMTTDVDAAKAFYGAVFGWGMEQMGEARDYTVVSAGQNGVGGIMALPAEARAMGTPPCWSGYIGVDDIDGCVAKIAASGGAVHRPVSDIPEVGRFAVVGDPQGAVFIVFTPNPGGEMPPAPAPGTPGLIGWNELYATDMPKAFDWYAALFGWTLSQDMPMGEMGAYRLFAAGAEPIGGMMNKLPVMPGPFWAYYVNVPSIGAAIERVRGAGGQVMNGPEEVPGPMWIANCQDPQGVWFSMVAPAQ